MMETKEKTYTLSKKQFEDVVLQIGILKQTYDQVAINKDMNLFQKNIILRNKEQNMCTIKDLEDIYEKSQ